MNISDDVNSIFDNKSLFIKFIVVSVVPTVTNMRKKSTNTYKGILQAKTVNVPKPIQDIDYVNLPVKRKKLDNSYSGILSTKSKFIKQNQDVAQNQIKSDTSFAPDIENQDYIEDQNDNDNEELSFAQHLTLAMSQSQKDFDDYENSKKAEEEELRYVLLLSSKNQEK